MSHGKAFFLRLIMILVAVALILGGLWGVGLFYHYHYAERVGEYSNRQFWADLSDKSWYPTLLGVVATVLILLGLWLWWLIVDRRRVSKIETKESADSGRVTVRLDDIASAVSQEITREEGVKSCNYKAEVDRGQKMLTLTLRCEPLADLLRVSTKCKEAAADIVAALPGEDVDSRFLIEVDRAASAN